MDICCLTQTGDKTVMRLIGIALLLLFIAIPSGSTVLIRRIAGGGGSPYNLGDSVSNSEQHEVNADETYWSSTAFTTTDAGTVGNVCVEADGIPGDIHVKIQIMSNASPHARVCISDSITVTESSKGFYCDDMSDDGCGTLSAATAYMFAVTFDNSGHIYWSGTGTWDTGLTTDGDFTTPPSTVDNFNSGDGSLNFTHPFSVYAVINP